MGIVRAGAFRIKTETNALVSAIKPKVAGVPLR